MSTKKVIEPEEPKITSEIARQMLEQDRQQREQKFKEELDVLIAKYNVALIARLTIIGDRFSSDVLVVANP